MNLTELELEFADCALLGEITYGPEEKTLGYVNFRTTSPRFAIQEPLTQEEINQVIDWVKAHPEFKKQRLSFVQQDMVSNAKRILDEKRIAYTGLSDREIVELALKTL
jgi:hypothetical protein